MSKDRFFIDKDYRAFISKISEKNILGLKGIEAKEVFEFAAALGMNNPSPSVSNRDGYFLLKNVKTDDKAILDTIYLGVSEDENILDSMSDFDNVIDYTENCADAGLEILKNEIESVGYDSREIIESRMLAKLDDLYISNVENNI